MVAKRRSQTKKEEAVAARKGFARKGLKLSNIAPEGAKRRVSPPDRLAVPPQIKKDRHGNKVFLPGSSAEASVREKVSGQSLKDIAKFNKRTNGRTGPGTGKTLHHHADLDSRTGRSTMSVVPTNVHANLPHIGSSAQKRSRDHGGDPDKQVKYGTTW
jgi:hypothetical protein